MDLLNKLLTLEISYLSKLPQKDQVACLEIMASYKNSFDQLSFYKNEFQDRFNSGETKGIERNSSLYLSFEGVLNTINKNAIHSKDIYFRQISNYFINSYSLDKSFFKDFEEKLTKESAFEPLELEKILQFVFSKTPRLLQAGFENVKNELHRRIWNNDKVIQKGAKLTISDLVSYDTSWNGKVSLYSYNEYKVLYNIILSFCYFDTAGFEKCEDYLSTLPNENYKYKGDIDFNKIYEVPSLNIVSIKFFKNRRLDITFSSSETCSRFVAMFGLNEIKKDY